MQGKLDTQTEKWTFKALITKFNKQIEFFSWLNFHQKLTFQILVFRLLTSFDRIEIGLRHVWLEDGYILGRVISFEKSHHFCIGTSCLQRQYSIDRYSGFAQKCTIQNLTPIQQRIPGFFQTSLILVEIIFSDWNPL